MRGKGVVVGAGGHGGRVVVCWQGGRVVVGGGQGGRVVGGGQGGLNN